MFAAACGDTLTTLGLGLAACSLVCLHVCSAADSADAPPQISLGSAAEVATNTTFGSLRNDT